MLHSRIYKVRNEYVCLACGSLGHRGRKGDLLYGIQNLLAPAPKKRTEKQWERFETAIAANEDAHLAVYVSWSCSSSVADLATPT